MSLSVNPLKTFKVLEPLVDLNESREYAILKGGQENSFKPVISTSFSNSSATFSAPPPNPNIIVDRKLYLKMPVNIQFTGTAPVGQNLLQTGFDAPRAFPLSSICNVMQVTLNNTSVSINMSDVISPITRFYNPVHVREGDFSSTPTQLDQAQNYADLANSVRNPLAGYGDSNDGSGTGRGAFPMTVVSNTNTTAEVDLTLTEALLLSPFYFGDQRNAAGFIGLQTMDFVFNWVADLSRIWSHDNSSGSALTTVTVTLGQPQLLFHYITPDPLVTPIPEHREYSYFDVQRYPTDTNAAVASGATVQISSQNIQLQSIPRKMYIFARRRNADQTFLTTDTFLGLRSININWNNRSGLLSSASAQDLYHMSRKNGVNMTWQQWSGESYNLLAGGSNQSFGGVGSVLAIEFGTDIGLGFDEAAGIDGTFQLQFTATFENVNTSEAITPTLYAVVISEGVFTIENNRAMTEIGVISRRDVVESKDAPSVDYNDLKLQAMYGGNILGSLKEGISKVGKFIKEKAAPFVREKVLPIAKTVAPARAEQAEAIMDVLGLGMQQGGVVIGGKKMSRAQLKKRLAGM